MMVDVIEAALDIRFNGPTSGLLSVQRLPTLNSTYVSINTPDSP
jgi:hypothetical protein